MLLSGEVRVELSGGTLSRDEKQDVVCLGLLWIFFKSQLTFFKIVFCFPLHTLFTLRP